MTNEIAGRWNIRTGARVSGNGWRGVVGETSNIGCYVETETGDLVWYAYGEFNADSEFTFERI
jgi:hypothetical protein